jgi:dTDP-4-dehydrorhamnose reductase
VESDLPNPLNVYGRSKAQGERYVQELTEDGLIVRTQWLFGKYEKNFISSILRQVKEMKDLSVVNDQTGSPTYTVDLAKAISALIQYDAKGIFHVANSDTCTWYAYAQSVLEFSGTPGMKVNPISSKELNRPAVRLAYSEFSCQKLKQATGIVLRPWSEAVKEYLNSY